MIEYLPATHYLQVVTQVRNEEELCAISAHTPATVVALKICTPAYKLLCTTQ